MTKECNCGGGCGCGNDCSCEHDHDFDEMDYEMISLTLDDGKEMECLVLGVFELEEREYIALVHPETEQVLLYRYCESEDGEEFELENIEDDEEFEKVSEVFFENFSDEEDFEEE